VLCDAVGVAAVGDSAVGEAVAESQSGTLGQVQKSRLLGTQNLGSMNPWSLRSLCWQWCVVGVAVGGIAVGAARVAGSGSLRSLNARFDFSESCSDQCNEIGIAQHRLLESGGAH
jgi:hypothetical protein